MNMLFVVSGPSGCGKSTIIKRLLRRVGNLRFSVSHTTRKRRAREVDGKHYHFVSREVFDGMVRKNRFAEWAVVHGHSYGTARAEIEAGRKDVDVLLDLDIQGARQIKTQFREAVFIFIMPPVYQELRRRLRERKTENAASIAGRLENARREIRAYREFDHIVINDDLAAAVKDVESIIRAVRTRPRFLNDRIEGVLRSFGLRESRK